MSDPPDDEIEVFRATYGSGEKPGDQSFTFRRHGKKLPSREVERDGDRFFIVTLPDGTVRRFREAEPVESIPGGDPPD